MKLLAAADIHGRVDVYEWLIGQAREKKAELVILAGDLSASSWEEEEQRQEAEMLISVMKRFPVTTLYLMGNDDFFALDYEDERVKRVHGQRLEFGGYGFVGYQSSPPFIGGPHEKPDEEIDKDVSQLEPLLDDHTVFITHAPMYGVLDRTFGGEQVGSRALAALLERRPVLAHIHGHIHESFGRDGNHFNVACAGRRRAFLIELPSLNHEVIQAS